MGTAVGCKTWKVTGQINKLHMFINQCLQRIMGIRWRKIKSNSELCEATGEKPRILPITMRKWRWISHTLRNDDESIEKQAHRIGIHRGPEGYENWSKPEKGPFWKKHENGANLEWGEKFHGHLSQMQMLHKYARFIMQQKGILLLLLSYCQKCNQMLEGTVKEYVLWSLLGIMDISETGGYVGSCCLIGYDVIGSGRWIPVLHRNLLAPSAEHWTAWHRITWDCHLLWVLLDAALFVFYELFC